MDGWLRESRGSIRGLVEGLLCQHTYGWLVEGPWWQHMGG